MGGPLIFESKFARSGVIVADDTRQVDAFHDACRSIEKVLGKGVHPLAIGRLVEIWPDAHVEVEHFDDRYDGVDLKVTQVRIYEKDPNGPVAGDLAEKDARCRLDCDRWERRRGITLAFNRALKEVPR